MLVTAAAATELSSVHGRNSCFSVDHLRDLIVQVVLAWFREYSLNLLGLRRQDHVFKALGEGRKSFHLVADFVRERSRTRFSLLRLSVLRSKAWH